MHSEFQNIAYAEYAWPESYDRQQLEVRCIDSSHLLTRTRRKVYKGGIERLSSKHWLKAASTRKTFFDLSNGSNDTHVGTNVL
ncbi:hypothetical protein KUTeg_025050 [Tegillarca granosa]|uniref:Uncharacterized protein n=1 Tax=Tegillarca granosa TaxID=220873 RepID=A0ABQ9DYY6_TEGGR|nr:hypothetical protein KUTeg_025050 [Tegillarca granosa]